MDHQNTSCGDQGACWVSWSLSLFEAQWVFVVLSKRSFGLWCNDYPQNIAQLYLVLMLRENKPQAERQSGERPTDYEMPTVWTDNSQASRFLNADGYIVHLSSISLPLPTSSLETTALLSSPHSLPSLKEEKEWIIYHVFYMHYPIEASLDIIILIL